MLRFRKELRQQLDWRSKARPQGLPPWLLAPALQDDFSARSLDFDKLGFMFGTKKGVGVHDSLLMADARLDVTASLQDLERIVGPDKRASLADTLDAALWGCDSDAVFVAAFTEFRVLMVEALGEHESMPRSISPAEGLAEQSLPPLPRMTPESIASNFRNVIPNSELSGHRVAFASEKALSAPDSEVSRPHFS